jgi:1-acyl-sn-glycerol-3-phosphate acyltransferase
VLKPPMMALASRDWPVAGPLATPGGVVVAVNHISHVDPLVVAHFLYDMDRPARFLAKSSLFETPLVGAVFRGAGQIEVHRESEGAADSLREAVAAVRAGECVVIYPEGTISRDRALWPMSGKTGAARIAFETGCRVVPMGVWGPQQLLGPYAKRPRLRPRPTMRIRLGAPVPLGDLQPEPGTAPTGAVLAAATDRIMDAITELVAGLRGQPAPAGRLDLHDEALARIGDAHVDYDWAAIAGGVPHDRRPA